MLMSGNMQHHLLLFTAETALQKEEALQEVKQHYKAKKGRLCPEITAPVSPAAQRNILLSTTSKKKQQISSLHHTSKVHQSMLHI